MKEFVVRHKTVSALLIVAILSVLIIFMSIDKTDYSDLENFDFILSFGAHGDSIINTFDSTLTNAYYSPDNYTAYKIPKMVKKRIYKLMYQLDILECNNHLSYGVYDFEHPTSYRFEVSINGEEKTIWWSLPWTLESNDIAKFSAEQKAFLSFANFIIKHVRGTKEYKELPKPTRFYL